MRMPGKCCIIIKNNNSDNLLTSRLLDLTSTNCFHPTVLLIVHDPPESPEAVRENEGMHACMQDVRV